MAKPIYICFRAKVTEAWYQLSKQEQDALFEKVEACVQQVGGKTIIGCNARWASEEWLVFGVEEYPDIEAVQRHAQLQEDLNWYRYVNSETLLGTAWEQPA